ncbi:MAG: FadR family transcriptional regulator [Kiritimatiellae bacterium]|nr:FadR family transcriptional regulator [Kiritimatiellia bacterium]HRX35933.1 GntR family transcriptional regulator [Aestuariivirga sp.]
MPARKTSTVAEELRKRIAAGEWQANAAMPNERDLATGFGVARNTIRGALAALEEEGLISRQVGRGTIVKQQPSDELKLILDKFAGASPLDILNLRLIIEPQVAASAAINASARDLAAIDEADAEASRNEDVAAYDQWDNSFHALIYRATHNDFLIDFWNLLAIVRYREPMQVIRHRGFTLARRNAYCIQHRQIRDALHGRNSTAAHDAMKLHLAARRRNYFGD